MEVLNRHAPLKKKILRANHSSYMSKTLRKAVVRWFYLEKKYFKKNRLISKSLQKNRKIIAVDFIRKKEKSFSMG